MIRGKLLGQAGTERLNPKAIVISNIAVQDLLGRYSSRLWDGLVDTGADRSALPQDLIRELNLPQMNRIRIRGYDGARSWKPVFCCELIVPGLGATWLTAVPTSHSHLLLGRDFLAAGGLALVSDHKKAKWSLRGDSFLWRIVSTWLRL